MSLPRPSASPVRCSFLALAAVSIALCAACPRSAGGARELPAPPSIVVAPPASPVAADEGKPGTWQALPTNPVSRAFVVDAEGQPEGALLIVHTEWGVDGEMRDLARSFAARRLTVVVPDLYEGVESTSRVSSQVLIAGVGRERSAALLAAGLDLLKSRPGVAGRKVVLLGIGVGGNWGYALAGGGAALDGVVFDTAPIDKEELPGRLAAPVLMLTGAENLSLAGSRHDRIVAGFEGRSFEWKTVAGAGTTLFDARALGFSRAALDTALDEVVAFVKNR